jgi:GNAT superfamily N-acetyltransferase
MPSAIMNETPLEMPALPEIRVERARIEHPDDAVALIEEYYEAIGVVARDDRARLLHYLEDPESAIWVAYSGDAAIGCIVYRPLRHISAAAEIKRLYVRPRYRSRGAARHLLQTLEQFARQQRIEWLYLDTKDDLEDAIAFYRRHAYQTCARYNDNPQATIFLRKQLSAAVAVRTFQPGDETAFRELNQAWIEEYFGMEEKDYETLDDPYSSVLAPGGQIFTAVSNEQPVGCCALVPLGNGTWELAKMGVAKHQRGRGIGRLLLEYAIGYAKERSIRRLYIETNSQLLSAIHLYESVGFRHIPPERVKSSPYARANVFLEMSFE